MSVKWMCDKCGIPTHLDPPREHVIERFEKVRVPSNDPKIEKYQNQPIPKMETKKTLDPISKKMVDVSVPVMKDLEERTYIVELRIGQDRIQRDFCKKCLDSIESDILNLKSVLEKFDPK